jgi:hypothetical protein
MSGVHKSTESLLKDFVHKTLGEPYVASEFPCSCAISPSVCYRHSQGARVTPLPGKLRIVAPMHRLAHHYADQQRLETGTYITVTQAKSLKGLPANTPIIVIDTPLQFDDSRGIYAALARFTNVTRVTR